MLGIYLVQTSSPGFRTRPARKAHSKKQGGRIDVTLLSNLDRFKHRNRLRRSGCGGSSSGNNSDLTATQVMALGHAVYDSTNETAYTNAIKGAMQTAATAGNCPVSGCMFEGFFNCSGGGTVSVSGTVIVGNGPLALQVQFTPASCDEGGIVLNGDQNLALAAQVTMVNDVYASMTATLIGGVSFVPDYQGPLRFRQETVKSI